MTAVAADAPPGRWRDSDLAYAFRRSPVAQVSLVVTVLLVGAALAAPWIAPFDVTDPAVANVVDARLPPGAAGLMGDRYWLGTDPQGRDMISAMIFGLRTSLLVGIASVLLAAAFGITVGLLAGYAGGLFDAAVMRLADIQLSFPAILIALLLDGIARTVMPRDLHEGAAVPILVAAIGASYWVQYARTVRGVTLVERGKDYVQAAAVTGVSTPSILVGHILPNVAGPVLVIATINLALAILTEATLSFLGVNEFLFSGDWWIAILPGALLVLLSLAVNLLGDWLRDTLNPRLGLT
jgi:peptide/nickel transport system permease protein